MAIVDGARPSTVPRVLPSHDVILGVGHEAEHDTGRITHSGDVGDRSVRVHACVAKCHLTGRGETVRIGVDVAALTVRDRAVDDVVETLGPHADRVGDRLEFDPPAIEGARLVVAERAGQQTCVRVSTWKPLQMPITGRPAATNARSSSPTPTARSRASIRPAPSESA